jgi:hypothetical protein
VPASMASDTRLASSSGPVRHGRHRPQSLRPWHARHNLLIGLTLSMITPAAVLHFKTAPPNAEG